MKKSKFNWLMLIPIGLVVAFFLLREESVSHWQEKDSFIIPITFEDLRATLLQKEISKDLERAGGTSIIDTTPVENSVSFQNVNGKRIWLYKESKILKVVTIMGILHVKQDILANPDTVDIKHSLASPSSTVSDFKLDIILSRYGEQTNINTDVVIKIYAKIPKIIAEYLQGQTKKEVIRRSVETKKSILNVIKSRYKKADSIDVFSKYEETFLIDQSYNKVKDLLQDDTFMKKLSSESGLNILEEKWVKKEKKIIDPFKQHWTFDGEVEIKAELNDPDVGKQILFLYRKIKGNQDGIIIETKLKTPAGILHQYQNILDFRSKPSGTEVKYETSMKVAYPLPKNSSIDLEKIVQEEIDKKNKEDSQKMTKNIKESFKR